MLLPVSLKIGSQNFNQEIQAFRYVMKRFLIACSDKIFARCIPSKTKGI
jgi:hypothetical protein